MRGLAKGRALGRGKGKGEERIRRSGTSGEIRQIAQIWGDTNNKKWITGAEGIFLHLGSNL